ERLFECFQEFIDATSNAAVENAVCGVCARELNEREAGMRQVAVSKIPNQAQLVPVIQHPAHDLYNECLLEPTGIIHNLNGEQVVNICHDCFKHLSSASDGPPHLALANNMWIGCIPWELQVLTLPEHLLIALVHLRIYIVKLYPKDKDFRPDPTTLQRGMHRTSMGLPLCWKLEEYPEDDVPIEIADVICQTNDTGVVDEENGGFVPENEDIGVHPDLMKGIVKDDANMLHNPEAGTIEDADDPDVIPFEVSDLVDTNLTKMTSAELMMWGLLNLWNKGREGGYSVRHGRQPVRNLLPRRQPDAEGHSDASDGEDNLLADEDTLNYFERAFPGPFPYGCGGIEGARPKVIDFPTHIHWALQYHNRRFCKHNTFPFVCFGIKQKRQALAHASIQIQRQDFKHDLQIMADITADRLKLAAEKEAQGLPPSDPAVRLLRKHVQATTGCVVGTDHS
ncbi:hypothetical protein PHLCEN_2v5969, partial [Hermanssonia centrifuga]